MMETTSWTPSGACCFRLTLQQSYQLHSQRQVVIDFVFSALKRRHRVKIAVQQFSVSAALFSGSVEAPKCQTLPF